MRKIVHGYYEAWAARRRDDVRVHLADQLVFRSPQDSFDSADAFLSACWKYSSALVGVEFAEEVYDGNKAFVILRWMSEDGSSFADAEYLWVEEGKVSKIVVVNNDSSFGDLLR
jgi:hypothetical protein